VRCTFPPSTSSPIIIQPAVCIILCPLLSVSGVDDVMTEKYEVTAAADLCVELGRGRDK
jgi:hypothetical protein